MGEIKKRTRLILSVIIIVSGLLIACGNTTGMPTDSVSNPVSDSVEAAKDIVEVKEYERFNVLLVNL